MKIIELEYETEIWELPLEIPASHRALYYKDKDGSDYQEEFDYVMNDEYEGIDWLQNNMRLDEFEQFVKKIQKENNTPDWCNPINTRIKEEDVLEKNCDGGQDDN